MPLNRFALFNVCPRGGVDRSISVISVNCNVKLEAGSVEKHRLIVIRLRGLCLGLLGSGGTRDTTPL